MVEFEESALMMEVGQIVGSGANPVHFAIDARIDVAVTHTTINPLKLTGVDIRRDYLGAYSDELVIELQIPMGAYAKLVYPYKNAIDITLAYTPLNEVGDSTDQDGTVQSETYTATLVDRGSPLVEQNGANAPSQLNLDLTNLATVHFQLVNKALEQMRMISVGQVFRAATVDDVIRSLLTSASQTTTVNGQRTVQGVTMVKSANPDPRQHIVIPHGVRLVDVPQYIHQHCGGVYNAGMGYYLQGNQWYVYPALDTTRFNSAPTTLTVINVPRNRFPEVERTYRQSGNNIVIMANGNTKFRDPSNQHQLNLGNGIRFSDASKFMAGFASVSDNRALASRGANNNEFIVVKRPNGNNNVHVSSSAITANSLDEYSRLSAAMGSTVMMEWQNSRPDLVTPGMPARVLYLEDEQIRTMMGVVTGAHHYSQLRGQGITATRFVTGTVLNIFVQPQDQAGLSAGTP